MNCQRVQIKLSAYVDGELTGVESLEIRDHLSRCKVCQRELDSVQQIKQMLTSMSAPEPRFGFESELSQRVFAAEAVRPRESFWRIGLVAGVATAAVVFVTLQVTTAVSRQSSNTPLSPIAKRNSSTFTVSQDTAYFAGADPLSAQAPVMTTAYGDH